MPDKIKPTLFIGLGTTGAQILGYLQEMIFEEYLTPEFPVIRLLALITARGDRQWLSGLEDKNIIHLQVPSTQVVQAEIQNPKSASQKALREWIPDDLFKIRAFVDGSANIRVAGRLHLWHNYDLIIGSVTDAVGSCLKDDSSNRANKLFHLRETGETGAPTQNYIDRGLNIFIVGTLSGGSCSGMVPEFGYMLKSTPAISGLGDSVSVIGVFTTPNAAQTGQKGIDVYCCNSYTCLSELNYKYHPSARDVKALLPNGVPIDTSEYPYDYFYALTPTNMNGDSMIGVDNKFDHDALLQMMAMSLFMDVFAGTYSAKEGMRDNYKSAMSSKGDRSFLPDSRGRKPRYIMSFGAASIAIPKYRLARAAACKVAERVLDQWLSPTMDDVLIDKRVNQFLENIQQKVLPRLTKRQGYPSIEEDIAHICQVDDKILMYDSITLQKEIRNIPSSADPLERRFEPEGEYHQIINTQYNMQVSKEAKKEVQNLYDELRGDRRFNLPAVLKCLEKVAEKLKVIKSQYEKMSTETGFRLAVLNPFFNYIRKIEKDWWLAILIVKSKAVEERKRQILKLFEGQALRALRGLRAQYVARVIDDALGEIESLQGLLNSVIRNLEQCHSPQEPGTKEISKIYQRVTKTLKSPPKNMRYLYPRGTAEKEIAGLVESANPQAAERLILSGIARDRVSKRAFEESVVSKEPEELADEMLVEEVRDLLGRMRTLSVMTETLNQWNAEFESLVNYSASYIEVDPHYMQSGYRLIPPGQQMWTTAFAPADNVQEIQQALIPKLPIIQHSVWKAMPLGHQSHRMIFYCEEPFFSTTFMSAYPLFENIYKKFADHQTIAGEQPCLFWTDKRWATSPPDLDLGERAKHIKFVLETALEVARGAKVREAIKTAASDVETQEIETRLFKYTFLEERRGHYFEMDSRDVGRVRVSIGDESDYEKAAQWRIQKVFIPYMRDRMKKAFQNMERQKFEERWDRAYNAMAKERDLLKSKGEWDDGDEKEYRDNEIRLKSFLGYIKKIAWNIEPTDADHEYTSVYPWFLEAQ